MEQGVRKQRTFKLSARLQACLELLPNNSKRLIDVGCDHGLLAVKAFQEQKCDSVLAIDIEEGPLARAAAAFAKYKMSEDTQCLLNDGLKDVDLHEGDSIVIAGVGGLEICDILTASSYAKYLEAGFDPELLFLVVQPMKSQALFRLFMALQSFELVEERLVNERGHLYMQASYRFPKQSLDPSIKDQLLYEKDDVALRKLRQRAGLSIADAMFGIRLAKQYQHSGTNEMSATEKTYIQKQLRFLSGLSDTNASINGLGRVAVLNKEDMFSGGSHEL